MRRRRHFQALFPLLLSLASTGSAAAATRLVDTSGSDAANDCLVTPCLTIGYALQQSQAGDTISIGAGTFAEATTLYITHDLKIVGAGPLLTAISISSPPRVLEVLAPSAKVDIQGVEIRDGVSPGDGGGIRNAGKLVLHNVHIRENSAGARGGGINNLPFAFLWMYDCLVEGNTASGEGGGIFNDNAGTLVVVDSYVTGNSTTTYPYGHGGGVANFGLIGEVTILRSSIAENTAAGDGGGILNRGTLRLVNSTIAVNHAARNGGALFSSGDSQLTHVTVANNTISVENPDVESFNGGGIVASSYGSVDLRNTIVAGNSEQQCQIVHAEPFKLTASVTGLGSLSSDNTCDLWPGWNLIGVDPTLGPLDYHGGKTPSYSLLAGSLAIDAASDKYWTSHDQRGLPRPVDGNGDGTAAADIGSFEVQATEGPSRVGGNGKKRDQIWRRQGPKKPPQPKNGRIDR